MRRFWLIFLACLVCTSTLAEREVPLEVLRLRAKLAALEQPTHSAPAAMTVTFYPGSLRNNITLLAHEFGWHTVVWEPDADYQWVGLTHFHQADIKKILGQVLQDLPLQATFYTGNHVLVISARELG